MSTLSTHILDVVLGSPAKGVSVCVERKDGGLWGSMGECVTDADGRCRQLVPDAAAGIYRITFHTAAYFERQGRASIYPEVSVVITCDGKGHYHVPLLLSDNSYTTYRGS